MNYYDFLAKKQVQNVRSGFEADVANTYAFEWQKAIAEQWGEIDVTLLSILRFLY